MKLYVLMAIITFSACYLCFIGWFIWHVVKKFGFEALLIKGAALLDGMLIVGGIMSRIHRIHPLPDSILHYGVRAFDLGCLAALSYVVLFDRPTRWLLKPFVKWALYGMWIGFVVGHGIKEG